MKFFEKISSNFGCLTPPKNANVNNSTKSKNDLPLQLSSAKGPTLFQIPCNLLIHQIFARLNVREICRLKQVCRWLNVFCANYSQFLPRQNVQMAVVRCGQWHDVLKVRRASRNDTLTNIELTTTQFRGRNSVIKRKWKKPKYQQLIEHFEIWFALVDVQLLNDDTMEQLQLGRIAVKHLLMDFSLCSCWSVRQYIGKLIGHLVGNKFARRIDMIFDKRKALFVKEMLKDGMDKRISIIFSNDLFL